MKLSYPPLPAGSGNTLTADDHLLYGGHIISAHTLIDMASEYGVQLSAEYASALILEAISYVKDGLADENLACEDAMRKAFGEARQLRITFSTIEESIRSLRAASNAVLNSVMNNMADSVLPAVPQNKMKR